MSQPTAAGGWAGPGAAQPAGSQPIWTQGGIAPNAYRVQGGVTGLAKIGAVILIAFGLLWTLVGLAIAAIGSAGAVAVSDLDPTLRPYIGTLTGIFVGLGVFIAVLAVLEVLVGIFAFRGAGFARFVGSIYAWFFGLVLLLAALGGGNSSTGNANSGSGTVIVLVFAIGYLFTAVVFAFRWRSRPGG